MEIRLNKGAIESAFALKAREFARESANIFWLRDLKINAMFEGHDGPFVPNEQDLVLFCEAVGISLCRGFDLNLDSETKMAYCTLAAGPITAYVRIAPLDDEDENSPVIIEVGFLLSISTPTIMPIDGFLERTSDAG
jgi:hypothetical protein